MTSPEESREGAVTATGYRTRSYYLLDELHERIKAAWWATRELPEGEPALGTLVGRLFEAVAKRLEELYNNGERFPPAPRSARGVDPEAAKRQGAFMADVWAGKRDGDAPSTNE